MSLTKLINLFNKRTVLIILFFLLSVSTGYSQSRQVKKAIRNKEKREQQDKKAYEKLRKETLKRRYNQQTEAVKERMKRSADKSKRWNNSNKKPFYKSLFTKNRRKKRRR